MQGSILRWIKKNTTDLKGKVVAISGATGGLGRELCRYFVYLGAALILLDRNMTKSKALADELRAEFEGTEISHIRVDMEDMESVKASAEELLGRTVDFLVLNAGAYSIPRHKCSTGYDNVFQINFISPYYLARKLLPRLRERGGKVVAVGSIAHNYSKTDPEDIDFSTRRKASLVYGNAKRYLMFALSDILCDGSGVVIAHPGITFTNITAHYPKLIFAIIKHPMKVIFMSPKKAALSILRGLFEDCEKNEWIGPSLFNVWGHPKRKRINTCSDREIKRICDTAERIYSEIA